MPKSKIKKKCPCCAQISGVQIIYGSVDMLSESLRHALTAGAAVLGGMNYKWDWEEELIDTRCSQCQHEWHAWPPAQYH
jgi:hypothetical protein